MKMMNKQDILRKIGGIINELSEQYEYLNQVDKINILELELFTANADFLIDHIEILKKLNENSPVSEAPQVQPQPVIYPAQTEEEAIVQEKIPAEEVSLPAPAENESQTEEEQEEPEERLPEPAEELAKEAEIAESREDAIPAFRFDFSEEPADMTFDFEKKIAVEEVFDRQLTEDEQRLIEEKQKDSFPPEDISAEADAVPATVIEEKQENHQETLPVMPTIPPIPVQEEVKVSIQPAASRPQSLNELLSEKVRSGENSNFARPVSDLKAAVSLNDKMIFIKELFNGYNLAYSEAIEILNRFDSFDAAENFLLKNYADKNNWAEKQETVNRFYDILKRKFGAF